MSVPIRIYRARRLDALLAPPEGEDFDADRDAVYAELLTGSFGAAVAFARTDFHECGHVEQMERVHHITNIIAAWEVYPDGTTRSYEP